MRRRLGLPDTTGHVPLLAALGVDALGSGVFLPFSVLYFTATTSLSIAQVGLALSIAAGLTLPFAPLLGMLVDRLGAWPVLLVANLAQGAGVACYLLVSGFGSLILAAATVAVGGQAFWASYTPLIAAISRPGDRERWFGLVGALRNAGLGVGGLASGIALSVGGTGGYRAVAAVNAASFGLAAALLLLDRPSGRRAPARRSTVGGWRMVLTDRPFLALASVNVAFATGTFALTVVLPVYAVTRLGLSPWLPGVALTLNCLLIAVAQGPVVQALTGRVRVRVLRLSATLSMTFALIMLLAAAVPTSAGVVVVLVAVTVFTLGELMETPVIGALSAEAAPDHLRGRYVSVFQLSWNVSNTAGPALLTALLAAGTWPVWAFLALLAAAAGAGISAVATRLPAAQGVIGEAADAPTLESLDVITESADTDVRSS